MAYGGTVLDSLKGVQSILLQDEAKGRMHCADCSVAAAANGTMESFQICVRDAYVQEAWCGMACDGAKCFSVLTHGLLWGCVAMFADHMSSVVTANTTNISSIPSKHTGPLLKATSMFMARLLCQVIFPLGFKLSGCLTLCLCCMAQCLQVCGVRFAWRQAGVSHRGL